MTQTQPVDSKCLWHKAGIEEELNPFSVTSRNTFKNAASLRQDECYVQLQEHWDANPKGYYHRKCYSTYTHKRHLERLKAKRTKSESGAEADAAAKPVESNPAKKPRLSRSKSGITSLDKCVICQREKTQKRHKAV